jgi:hypothetical protein
MNGFAARAVEPRGGAVVLQPQRYVLPWDGTRNVLSVCAAGEGD